MAVAAESGTEAHDFQGLIDAVDDNLAWAEQQENLQVVIKDEMSVRPGLREIVFEQD